MTDSFCVMPFFGLELLPGKATTCCLLPSNANVEHIRQSMLQGQTPSECNACWHLEEQNITSDRQYKNKAFDFYCDKDIKFIKDDCKQGNYSPQIIKIYTSNLCNSTCVTCSAIASSAWAALTKSNQKKIEIKSNDYQSIDFATIKMLSFVGGEPLYEKQNFKILETLINQKNQDCFISFVTNGSIELTAKQINLLSKFSNLNFCLSIDGIDSKFEYMRYPLKWKVLQKNIALYKSLGIQLSVSYTLSNLNLLYYDETVEWFNNNNLQFNHNIVSSPSYFSVNSLTQHIKSQLPKSAKSFLREHCSDDDYQFELMIKNIELQDKLKNIFIGNFMPEMYKLIQLK